MPTATASPSSSPFGQQLRLWRKQRGLSQLQLATLAETTPRHVSFIETGRSRPGREMVMRLAECMDLPIRDRNSLLSSAGLPPAYPERDLDEAQLRPFKMAVDAILERHMPYPAAAADGLGRLRLANPTFNALFPGAIGQAPEDAIDGFFGPGPARDMIENWEEVAWRYVESRRREAARANDPRLLALAERALRHLDGIPRPPQVNAASPVVCPRLRVGDQIVETFTTVMRFEHAAEVTISELRVELIFPVDEVGDRFFRSLAGQADRA